MADQRHWGNIAYQALFKHLSEAPDGSHSWALHWHEPAKSRTRVPFEAKSDPTRLFEATRASLHCYFEEHPPAVQARR
jgi:hypothetical protein